MVLDDGQAAFGGECGDGGLDGRRRGRIDPDDEAADVAGPLGELDPGDARQGGQRDRRRVDSAADDDPKLVLVEAGEEVGRRAGLGRAAVVEDRDVVADPLDVVEDVGGVEDGGLAPELAPSGRGPRAGRSGRAR